ncbi:MAG: hypothetical protein LBU65_00905 [Planctomycetaceae bacterium]|nr:hypothetical protein [Planctomycetaceae bacterium]
MRRLTLVFLLLVFLATVGCEILPKRRIKPTMYNPFPSLTEVAVVPFVNRADGSSLSGMMVAKEYGNELSKIPGFNVMPQKSVEEAMILSGITRFDNIEDVRKLGRLLKADVVVVGDIHDHSSYYPPRLKLETKWYATNPYLQYIPKGYAMPWGTPEEAMIPDRILFEAEHELAREQLKTQIPDDPNVNSDEETLEQMRKRQLEQKKNPDVTFNSNKHRKKVNRDIMQVNYFEEMSAQDEEYGNGSDSGSESEENTEDDLDTQIQKGQAISLNQMLLRSGITRIPDIEAIPPEQRQEDYPPPKPALPELYYGPQQTLWLNQNQNDYIDQSLNQQSPFVGHYPGYPIPQWVSPEMMQDYGQIYGVVPPLPAVYPMMPGMSVPNQPDLVIGEPDRFPGLPSDWPDPRGFIPDGPKEVKPRGIYNNGPVMRHVALYDGNDSEFTQALADWDYLFRDDKRVVSWQSVLKNDAEFVRFCCRMSIWETLGSRGGAGKSQTVIIQPKPWYGGKPYR